MDLVEIRDDRIFCDSSMVAKKFRFKHSHVTKIIGNLIVEIENIKGNFKFPLIFKEKRNYRGTDYEAYLMSREFFSLLCMRFKGKSALEWQMKFNEAFYEMERAINHPVSMDDLNHAVARMETDKAAASLVGRALSLYKKTKKKNEAKVQAAIGRVQLSLGFTKTNIEK